MNFVIMLLNFVLHVNVILDQITFKVSHVVVIVIIILIILMELVKHVLTNVRIKAIFLKVKFVVKIVTQLNILTQSLINV